jgi:glycosyltransferase involved in cell wall biosynthesis
MRLKKSIDIPSKPMKEHYLFETIPELPTLTLRQGFLALLYAIELFLVSARGGYDLLVNLRGEIVDSFGDLVYFNAMPLKLMYIYPQIQPTHNVKWVIYGRLFSMLTKVIKRPQKVAVANSKFNKQIIEKHLGKKAIVIYPPVELDRIGLHQTKDIRENVAVTISRFRLAKGLEHIPEIAKLTENCRFVVIGSSDKDSGESLKIISDRAKALGVQSRIEIFRNRTFDFVLEKLYDAKVFLQTQTTEAFGMSVVEAMAAGCIPVVPRSGGPWLDILECKEGLYGFSYNSLEEAAEKIKLLLEDECLRADIACRGRKRASIFDSAVFDYRITEIIKRIGHSQPSVR